MKTILLFTDWFDPAYKAGGPVRSCVNFALQMQDDYELYVFTSDRDLNDNVSLPGIITDKWVPYASGNIKVFYASRTFLSWASVLSIIKTLDPDFIYLNSFFSKYFAVYPLLMKRFAGIRSILVMAPRGMLKQSALQFKPRKKKIYLSIFSFLGLQRQLKFQATDETEYKDIQDRYPANSIELVKSFPTTFEIEPKPVVKEKGSLQLIFVGRIHPIKNLDFLLQSLLPIKGHIVCTVAGTLEDQAYWNECEQIIKHLPSSVSVLLAGELAFPQLQQLLATQHIMVLPTKGENFGHAIFESLLLGKPVIISDQTPWKNLATQKAGWELPLQAPSLFSEKIQETVEWEQSEYNQWSEGARKTALSSIDNQALKNQYKKLFS